MSFYDHIIVGGGILGASIAYHISKKSNDTVLVLERNDFASGASSRSAGLELRVRELLRIPAYLGWLLWQIVLANVSILKLVFQPRPLEGVAPQVVRFKTTLKSDWVKFVLAQSITLTPGTVTIKIVGDEFFVHAISQEAADGLDGAMEGWIKHVYEPEQQEGAVT